VTAVLEVVTGLALLVEPSRPASLLLGSALEGAGPLLVARVAGAALLALGLACALARGDAGSRAASGLIAAMLTYNIAAAALLASAGTGEGSVGVALWPAVALHVVLALACLAALRASAVASASR
jgi:hypothetical protein